MELPQVQHTESINVAVVMQRQVPTIQTAQNQRQVPVTQKAQTTAEVPQAQCNVRDHGHPCATDGGGEDR